MFERSSFVDNFLKIKYFTLKISTGRHLQEAFQIYYCDFVGFIIFFVPAIKENSKCIENKGFYYRKKQNKFVFLMANLQNN